MRFRSSQYQITENHPGVCVEESPQDASVRCTCIIVSGSCSSPEYVIIFWRGIKMNKKSTLLRKLLMLTSRAANSETFSSSTSKSFWRQIHFAAETLNLPFLKCLIMLQHQRLGTPASRQDSPSCKGPQEVSNPVSSQSRISNGVQSGCSEHHLARSWKPLWSTLLWYCEHSSSWLLWKVQYRNSKA